MVQLLMCQICDAVNLKLETIFTGDTNPVVVAQMLSDLPLDKQGCELAVLCLFISRFIETRHELSLQAIGEMFAKAIAIGYQSRTDDKARMH